MHVLMQRTVTEVMTREVSHVEAEFDARPAGHGYAEIPQFSGARKDGELVGMISREDIMRALRDATSCGLGT
jgi:CBS domain-containing protein